MSDPFIGEINMFAGNFAPKGWAFCQGQLLPITQNTALFSLLGTTYGGDGRVTFGLPDLRGRVIVGASSNQGDLGELGGVENVTLTVDQMPSHGHPIGVTATIGAKNGNANQQQPASGRVPAIPTVQNQAGLKLYSSLTADTDIKGAQIGGNLNLANAGGSQPHTNLQPYLALNYIIALQGVFPQRP